jgi:hypothetical protein
MISFKSASQRIKRREHFIQEVVNKLEKDLDYLGVSGVEDKL